MSDTRSSVNLGRVGVWSFAAGLSGEFAAEAERLGYGAVWVGGSPPGDLRLAEELLDATSTIAVATGIVNIWKDDASTVASSYHRIAAKHPGRFLLGVGVGHPEAIGAYQQPYHALVDYLDQLDASGVPDSARVIAALGPRVLRLAGERCAGAHPYLTTPTHTRMAREVLGDGPLLAPEQKVVLDTDAARARATGRSALEYYLQLGNYVSNLRRIGFSAVDVADGGSDRLIDALAPHGDAAAVQAAVTAHFDAGADHVSVQVLGDDPRTGYRALADALRG